MHILIGGINNPSLPPLQPVIDQHETKPLFQDLDE